MGKFRELFRRRKRKAEAAGGEPTSPGSAAATVEEEMELVFQKFDSNGDGRISSSELGAIFESLGQEVTEEELERMIREADADGDGFISLEEFVDLNTNKVDPSAALEDLRHAFSVFDLDRNGSISAEELARVMRSLGECVSLSQCRKMIDGIDQDGDGLVSFEEFKVMMSKSPIVAALTKIE
ncbi:putative calcium-binding protein CML10 [Apostasia shenzhenica]|uniref:Putative calcium-binding protein CML10 n=1 Tax=Apostasia shenzhenica TaxID=1088818 RepID=A0A2I0BGR9_9ASPA|nr:putative calcium-binding protein CML10 [Apostasia shenzhenica]